MTTSYRIYDRDGTERANSGGMPRVGLRENASELAARLRHAEDQLAGLRDEPLLVATVVEIRGCDDDARMLVSMGPGNALDINAIPGACVGARVRLHRNSMQAIDVIDGGTDTELGSAGDVPAGTIVTVQRAGAGLIEAEIMGSLRSFRCALGGIQKGERVVLDPSLTFVIGSLGMPPAMFARAPKMSVAWGDIGGHDDAKAALREALELPHSHPALFKAYGKRPVRGVLLSGSSGCGKTLLAKAAATSIAKAHGHAGVDAGGFVYVKGPELLNAYIGRTEEAIRKLFEAARTHFAEHGYPAVVFLDECESLLGMRDRGQNISMAATIVPQFLAEMDGLDDQATMLILATNRPDMLDPAIVREGRIDRRVRVGRPSPDDAEAIFRIHLRERPLAAGEVLESAAQLAALDIYRDHDCRIVRAFEGPDHKPMELRLRHFASGAMIAGIVEQASTRAMMRDIGAAAGSTGAPSGISIDDLYWAIERAQTALAHTNHAEAILEMVDGGGDNDRAASRQKDIGTAP